MSVLLTTNFGAISIELYHREAPLFCRSFAALCARGYYDGTRFHRLVGGFILQGGDPTGTGRGGECSTGGYLPDELTPALRHTGAGILSAANAGPGTNGSQFFFTLAPCPFLDGKHTVFARVSGGMGVLRRMAEVPTGDGDRPREDVTIIRAEVVTPCPGA